MVKGSGYVVTLATLNPYAATIRNSVSGAPSIRFWRALVVVTPEPLTLQGTWLFGGIYVDDEDGCTYTYTEVLTLIGSGRAVSFNAVYDDTGTQIDDSILRSRGASRPCCRVRRPRWRYRGAARQTDGRGVLFAMCMLIPVPQDDRRTHYVRPAKAGAFSGRQTRRGKSQSPVA